MTIEAKRRKLLAICPGSFTGLFRVTLLFSKKKKKVSVVVEPVNTSHKFITFVNFHNDFSSHF